MNNSHKLYMVNYNSTLLKSAVLFAKLCVLAYFCNMSFQPLLAEIEQTPTKIKVQSLIQNTETSIHQGLDQNKEQAEPPVIKTKLTKKQIKEIKTVLAQVLIDDQTTRALIHDKQNSVEEVQTQDLKNQIDALWAHQQQLDKQNQSIVANILEKTGWPEQRYFADSEAAQTLFLVVQHADLVFQERFFPMMQKATESGDIPAGAFAQLHDSILVGKGESQRYGTQIKVNPDNGKPFFYPIADERNVDIRRSAVGLEPIADYAKLYHVEYTPPSDLASDEIVIENTIKDIVDARETEK